MKKSPKYHKLEKPQTTVKQNLLELEILKMLLIFLKLVMQSKKITEELETFLVKNQMLKSDKGLLLNYQIP